MSAPETVAVPLVKRRGEVVAHALIDAADAPAVTPHVWHALKSTTGHLYAYRHIRLAGRRYLVSMHREVLGLPPKGRHIEADHVNRDTLDNRRANLNRPSQGQTSRYRGVSWDNRSRRWIAVVYINGRVVFRRYIRDEETAALAAAEARRRLLTYAVD